MAYLFAAVPVLLIGAMVLSGPLILRTDDVANRISVSTPVAASLDPATGDPQVANFVLPNWDKKERINLLLVGVDQRDDDTLPRTDTMILATIDPVAKTVGIMSLPRDLKVRIPGYPDDKLNASYVFGERDKKPGGGIGLLARTIRQNFGVPVHYFASVDFKGFERIVDTFGGVNVDPPYPIKDDEYPTETYGYTGLYFPAGLQHLDGKDALRYARTRHGDNDFGRARRQQEVLLALRQQALTLELPKRFNSLLTILGDSVRTDLPKEQWPALVQLGQSIPRENIKSYSIQEYVYDCVETDAAGVEIAYLCTDWTMVRKRVREMIPDLPQITTLTPDARARIAVQNASGRPGFAARSVDFLKANGFAGAVVDPTLPANNQYLAQSVVYNYTNKGDMALLAATYLGLPEDAVVQGTGAPPPGVDILIVLGQDAPNAPPRPPRR